MLDKVLVFDIWGDYGYFRRGYTTTSTISYPFPSRTTIAGLISGILGLDRDSYYEIFNKENSKIGLKILNPIKKVRFNLNYINTKEGLYLRDIKGQGKRSQVQAEFIKNPKYRIYVSLDDDNLMNELYDLLSKHQSIYTPYLGISECIANFKLNSTNFIDLYEKNGENVHINSIIPKVDNNIIIEPNKKYGLVKTPCFFNNQRVVQEFSEFYYEEKGEPIELESCKYYEIGEDNVILF